ncbi:uncharacterized protein LOC114358344 isoform X2 [Ostrinia furnacalis]|uniref:uncharacterized protein LOC114358344 isoform X2 n=1 Tax=Ostrinia furnacalis TaxID=93504 RepID=UPI00103EBC58|nr:uncharacterized protein LOC114358344 isoform X2 [Ostrinia furnacalis]
MRLPRGLLASAALLLALAQHAAAKKPKTHLCPIGFDLAYTTDRKPVCYRLKNTPELFTDKFKDCAGNIFTTELYHSLNLTKTNHVIWTDFKSTYPGGPFVDWSYTDSTGRPFYNTYDVKYDASLGIDVELCVVIDPVSNFTAVECNADERHYRYCFVKPYPDSDERIRKDCKGFDNSTRFFSPASTCLTVVSGAGGGGLRATFAQAKDMCFKRGGTVINGGWRLLNSPVLNIAESRSMYPFPLGFTMTPDNQLLRLDSEFDTSRVPESEWHFDRVSESPDGRYVAIANETWQLVNSSFIFYKVICERPVKLEHIKLELSVEKDNDLVLTVDRPIKKNEIRCFTDSMKYYASQVKIEKDDDDYKFHLDPTYDGYYWCMQRDYKNYFVSASNKTLFVKRQEDTLNLYATKIRLSSDYNVKYIDSLHRSWKEKIKQFIFNRTRYIEEFGDSENITEGMLRSFMGEKDVWGMSEAEVIRDSRIKRLHLDLRTVLLHIELGPEMKPLPPGTRISLGYTGDGFSYLDVVFMRPAYVCKGFESLPSRKLGESETPGCSVFTCVGDFNEGVQWLETAQPDCTPTTTELVAEFALIPPMPTAIPLPNKHRESSSSSSESSEIKPPPTPPVDTVNVTTTEPNNSTFPETTVNITNPDTSWSVSTEHLSTNDPTEVSTVNTPYSTTELSEETTESPELPSTTQRPPQEQLNEVITELENLLLNGTVTLESLERPFDQVNEILDVDDGELEIPSDLLHLLDQLASTAILDGEARAIKVRDNVALMMADATPDNPVRGVRVVATTDARGTDVFTNATFDFLEGELTSSELLSSESEAVVYLPESVTREARRISFVAFRNERAFQSEYSVNSRVFSVNVENLTHFERGEVIDIHLTPLVGTPERNQSRVCAYWQFRADGSGGDWARDGCRLIRATQAGAMDTCRCDHLTHFAEVLVPRTVFSERDERALEILSVVGCCFSIAGLLLIGLTAALFRSWRRDYSNKIWLQLCAAILLVSACFLAIVFVDFERYDVPCMLVGVLLHYGVLASFCWMLVAAVLSYRRLVLVFTRDVSHKLLRAAAFAWGAPCAVVGVLLAAAPRSYAGRLEDAEPAQSFCYPTGLGLYLAVYAPIALMLLTNWVLFLLIVRSVFASRRIQRHGDSNEALRCASVSCLLVFLFGLPWIFGLFASNVVMAYFFNLTATYQGFVLFIFFVVGNKKTRDLWLNKLKIKQTRKVPVTSSTYTNRSIGPGWRAGTEGASSIEAKTSKPRSLTSPDDSRFS